MLSLSELHSEYAALEQTIAELRGRSYDARHDEARKQALARQEQIRKAVKTADDCRGGRAGIAQLLPRPHARGERQEHPHRTRQRRHRRGTAR